MLEAGGACNHQIGGQSQKQAVLHDSSAPAEAVGQSEGIGNRSEVAVENHVAGVGDEPGPLGIVAN